MLSFCKNEMFLRQTLFFSTKNCLFARLNFSKSSKDSYLKHFFICYKSWIHHFNGNEVESKTKSKNCVNGKKMKFNL